VFLRAAPHITKHTHGMGLALSLRISWLLRMSLPPSFLNDPTTILLSKTSEVVWRSPANTGRGAYPVWESLGHGMLHCFVLSLYLVPRSKYPLPSIFRWQTITRTLAWRCAARVYHSAVIDTPGTTTGEPAAQRPRSASFRPKNAEPRRAPARLWSTNSRSFCLGWRARDPQGAPFPRPACPTSLLVFPSSHPTPLGSRPSSVPSAPTPMTPILLGLIPLATMSSWMEE
jgi:hypothetical protein